MRRLAPRWLGRHRARALFYPDVVFPEVGMLRTNDYVVAVELPKILYRSTVQIIAQSSWKDVNTKSCAITCGCGSQTRKPATMDDIDCALGLASLCGSHVAAG